MTLTIKKRKERAYADHQPKWQRYQTELTKPSTKSASQTTSKATLHPYQRQYAHVYHQRLAALKPRCWQTIEKDADAKDAVKMERILELRETVRSVLVGSIVKEGGGDELHATSRCKSSQSVFVEDESGRCNLAVENVHDFCTGMVLGLMGTVGSDGYLQVEKIFYPSLLPHPTIRPKEDTPVRVGTPHMLLLSGLQCGDPSASPLFRSLILDYVRGHFGKDAGANVAQVIIAGGSTTGHDSHPTVGLKELDAFCLQLCALGVNVDILPGKDDPTTANWPQRPLHKSLLKYSDKHLGHLLSRAPNPYAAVHTDKYVLGTDGANVADLAKSLLTKEDDGNFTSPTHLQALRKTLDCGHLCPTGPDTVPTMPHPESDPMVLLETPHLYFAGNCNEYGTELVETKSGSCRLVCIPEFSKTGQVVLVNLETLDAKTLQFEDPQF